MPRSRHGICPWICPLVGGQGRPAFTSQINGGAARFSSESRHVKTGIIAGSRPDWPHLYGRLGPSCRCRTQGGAARPKRKGRCGTRGVPDKSDERRLSSDQATCNGSVLVRVT